MRSFTIPIVVAFAVSASIFGAVLSESAPAFSVSYTDTFADGTYACSSCGAVLFASTSKFASTERWPSFREAIPGSVVTRPDRSYGLDRTEVLCASCGSHVGHLFDDGRIAGDVSPEAGHRYCVLSSSLEFHPSSSVPRRVGPQ